MILSKNKSRLLILLILFLAFIVRLYGLTSESIWLDESFSIYNAQKPLVNILTLSDSTPPLYYLILSLFVKNFGIGEFLVRLPSVIFGVLSVLSIYIFSKQYFNEKVGILAALILAVSTFNIFYSQEARTYTLFTFLSILSMYFFLKYFRTDNSLNSISYFITTILLLYSHYFSLLILFSQNVFLFAITLVEKKYRRIKKWLAIQLLLFIVYLPAFVNLVNQIKIVNNYKWAKGTVNIMFINYDFSGGFLLSIIFPLLLLYGFYYFIKNWGAFANLDKQAFLLSTIWLIPPIIILIIYSLVFKSIFLTRYVIFCSIPLYILTSFSIDKLNKYIRTITLIVIILSSSVYLVKQIERIDKEQWRDISFYVKSIAKKEDVIIVEPGYYLLPFAYYYTKCFTNLNIYTCAANEKIYTIWNDLEQEISYLNYATRIIYIKRDISSSEKESDFLKFATGNFTIDSKKEFPTLYNGTISVYLLH